MAARAKHPVEKADLKVAQEAARWRDHPAVKLLGTASEIADQPQLYGLCWATIGLGVAQGNGRLARTGLRMLAAEWLATRAKSAIKHRIDRTRPVVPVDGGDYRMEKGGSHAKPLNSFPSGHTAGAVAVAVACSSEYPEHRGAALAGAAAIGAIQLPRCAHFASDVGVGAVIGLAAGWMVRRRRREDTPDPAPAGRDASPA